MTCVRQTSNGHRCARCRCKSWRSQYKSANFVILFLDYVDKLQSNSGTLKRSRILLKANVSSCLYLKYCRQPWNHIGLAPNHRWMDGWNILQQGKRCVVWLPQLANRPWQAATASIKAINGGAMQRLFEGDTHFFAPVFRNLSSRAVPGSLWFVGTSCE